MIREHSFFQREYVCYPISLYATQKNRDKKQLEVSDKLILPPSSLDHLIRYNVENPMMFKLTTTAQSEKSNHLYCGVLEFNAPDHTMFIPDWMMNNIKIKGGERVILTSVSIPKGTFVKIRPQSSSFQDLSNPKVVLEYHLKNFTTLYEGETIRIEYLDKDYDIDIVETKPATAICINNTNLEIDIMDPLDKAKEENSSESSDDESESPAKNEDPNDYWSTLGQGCSLNK